MPDREKLIELLKEAEGKNIDEAISMSNEELEERLADGDGYGFYADYLISKGVTVRERGRWIVPKIPHITVVGICSECGKMSDRNYNFCPNCGADMR